jgi:monoamine oxidase
MAHDVVVVGAGLAGLTAARELSRGGFDVVVLEGRDRVGGRTNSAVLAGVPVDLGASFVGPTQDAVLKLAADLGCDTTPTFNDGANLIRWRGRVRRYHGTIPTLGLIRVLDIGRIQWQFARIARTVSIAEPWSAPRAAKWDAITLGGWLHSIRATASSRDLMAIMARVTWGAEPDEVSMLHAVRYVNAAGGLDRMLDVVDGAQQDHFPGGSHQIATTMSAELGERVRLNATVTRIEWSDDAVAVMSSAGVVEARRAILAIPPAHRLDIDIAPAPPIEYQQLSQRWPQGALSKAYAAYRRPFWRDNGLSGQALSDQGPVFITFDVGPESGGPGVLLGFVDARDSMHYPRSSGARRHWRALAPSSAPRPPSPSTISITVGAQSLSPRAVRRPRYRRGRGRSSDRCGAARWARCTGLGRKPRTSGPGSWTVRCAPDSGRPPKWLQRSGTDPSRRRRRGR